MLYDCSTKNTHFRCLCTGVATPTLAGGDASVHIYSILSEEKNWLENTGGYFEIRHLPVISCRLFRPVPIGYVVYGTGRYYMKCHRVVVVFWLVIGR